MSQDPVSTEEVPPGRLFFRMFVKGLVTIIPIALTLLIVLWLAGLAEGGLGGLIRRILPESFYVPGMGLAAGVVLVFFIGVLSQHYLFQRLILLGEGILSRMPLVKSIFQATKDFVDYFGNKDENDFNQVVMVRHPELKISIMGFVTREDFSDLPFGEPGEVAVYLPLSYQVAGYTIYVPREWLEPIDMPFEDAVRLILTAAMSRKARNQNKTADAERRESAEKQD